MYERKVNYYETDQMAIVHHSNYIRWFEEARIDFMDKHNCPLEKLEEFGIQIPVVDVYCQYLSMVHFGETVNIYTTITKYTGTRLEISYEIYVKGQENPCTKGTSKHCFITKDGKVVSLKKANPAMHEMFKDSLKEI